MRKFKAVETFSYDQAANGLAASDQWCRTVLKRLSEVLPRRPLRILEIGAAQGRALVSLTQAGHNAYGVEPYVPAITVARQLAKETGLSVNICAAWAESLPFPSGSFDLVLAFSVMEHVGNLDRSLQEVFRVLDLGGVFWFSSASAMCPRQSEIRGFPFFGWYPQRLKLRVMRWALDNRPELVGYTNHPAINWWTPKFAHHILHKVGFRRVWDRWQMRLPSEEVGLSGVYASWARKHILFRYLGDVFVEGCSYTVQK